MNLKLVTVVSLFVAVPVIAFAQKDGPAAEAPKPTMADAQKFVRTISSDKAKLKAYCDMGTIQEEVEQAQEKRDNKALEALSAKSNSLLQQIGPEYVKMTEGLDEVDPDSDEGKRFAAVFDPLVKQCK
jgi:hypothetical protein